MPPSALNGAVVAGNRRAVPQRPFVSVSTKFPPAATQSPARQHDTEPTPPPFLGSTSRCQRPSTSPSTNPPDPPDPAPLGPACHAPPAVQLPADVQDTEPTSLT